MLSMAKAVKFKTYGKRIKTKCHRIDKYMGSNYYLEFNNGENRKPFPEP
jgi:hypothetical protein